MVTLQDTAGQEKYRPLVRSFLRRNDAILVVYAVNDSKTNQSVPNWVEEVNDTVDNCPLFLVGNKIDRSDRVVDNISPEAIKEMGFIQDFLVSAKDGTGIDDMFSSICKCQDVIDCYSERCRHDAGNIS